MIISDATWTIKYVGRLRTVNDAAADLMRKYLEKHSIVTLQDWNALTDYAYSLTTKYGEAAAALACEFYDAVAVATKADVLPAVPAEPPTYQEVAKAVRGTGKSGDVDLMSGAISRLVKVTGVDTTMKNALRDGAEWAWIPRGDTCAFCLSLASRGWQRASKKAIKNGHAEHIHANCDCTYAVRFDSNTDVEGYEPEKYLEVYQDAEGSSPEEKINSLRRQIYSEKKDEINAQKRAAYAARKEREKERNIPVAKNNYSKSALNQMDRRSLENIATDIFIKRNVEQGLTESEAKKRAFDLMPSNTDAQLRKYIANYSN